MLMHTDVLINGFELSLRLNRAPKVSYVSRTMFAVVLICGDISFSAVIPMGNRN
jgi:hypothetical protein